MEIKEKGWASEKVNRITVMKNKKKVIILKGFLKLACLIISFVQCVFFLRQYIISNPFDKRRARLIQDSW